MNLLPGRSLLAIAAVLDVALHARPSPVTSRALAERHAMPPRRFEPLLQDLVRAGILKGVRGPRGGYELARDRRRVTVADIVRATRQTDESSETSFANSIGGRLEGALAQAGAVYLAELDRITVEDLCRAGGEEGTPVRNADFAI